MGKERQWIQRKPWYPCNIDHNESYKAQIIAEMVNPAQTWESREAIKDDSPSKLHFKLYEDQQEEHTCTVEM